MIITKYLIKKIFYSLWICALISFSIFFIFSLFGNLGENYTFKKVLLLSILNAVQIFTYIPSYLLIISIFLFTKFLKSQNELVVIKEYLKI